MIDLKNLSTGSLLGLHAGIMEELRRRCVVRSANNPTGDLAESLFCRAFSWQREANSERGLDARDSRGTRYQIKGRRQTNVSGSADCSCTSSAAPSWAASAARNGCPVARGFGNHQRDERRCVPIPHSRSFRSSANASDRLVGSTKGGSSRIAAALPVPGFRSPCAVKRSRTPRRSSPPC